MNETGRPQDLPLSNPRADRVRDVAKLAGRPARLKRGQFLAEGPQAVREALKLHQQRLAAGAPGVVTEVFASESCLDRFPEFEELAQGTNARLATEDVLVLLLAGSFVRSQGGELAPSIGPHCNPTASRRRDSTGCFV
jgi:TrmH family RNA methyltransferase